MNPAQPDLPLGIPKDDAPLRRICNPAELNISICNAIDPRSDKSGQYGKSGLKILILTAPGLQIRGNCGQRRIKNPYIHCGRIANPAERRVARRNQISEIAYCFFRFHLELSLLKSYSASVGVLSAAE